MEEGKFYEQKVKNEPDYLLEQRNKFEKQNLEYKLDEQAFESRIKEVMDDVTEQQINTFIGQGCMSRFSLQNIEDNVLGFYQQRTKVFIFGEAPKHLYGNKIDTDYQTDFFQQSIKDKEIKEKNLRKEKVHQHFKDLETEYQDYKQIIEMHLQSVPSIIEFPKFTKQIVSVSAGLGHALALTNHQEMYSWGLANYGALGFGYKDENHLKEPKKLEIYDHHSEILKIIQIACGKYHSMCLTDKHEIYSWGEGTLGRLGHGQACEDILKPKLIYKISQREPFFISAGESHSAAITKDNELYTWGNGGYGRLGHGYDQNETVPKLVEALLNEKIINVSCGSMHTLAVTKNNQVYAFGQTKYGKLGVHKQNLKEDQPIDLPTKISMYKYHNQQEISDLQEIFQVFASVNHSFALSKQLNLYSWGFKGRGILGRDTINMSHQMAFPVPFIKQSKNHKTDDFLKNLSKLAIKFQGVEYNHKSHKEDQQINLHFQIDQACCNATNTVLLSNHGEVFVYGDNTFGQRACKEIQTQYFDQGVFHEYKKYSMPTLVQFKNPTKIKYISCGGFHMFAQTSLDEVYGWGRADEGQLGVGILTDKVFEPQLISEISYQGICQICCGDNFSGALSIFGEVYVTGSLDGGKLGLGKGFRNGFKLSFSQISDQYLPPIKYIACGTSHMLAISQQQNLKKGTEKLKSGVTYAWGKNQRGQLGIGNKENQYLPTPITGCKEILKKVQCGYNFSLGLSQTNKVYFWGNYKYFASQDQSKDVEEPRVIARLEGDEIVDITCSYKQCYALLKQGTIRQWGRFIYDKKIKPLLEQKKGKKSETELTINNKSIALFPESSRFQIKFESIQTSQNHAIGLTHNRKLYAWGLNNLQNRLGLFRKYDEAKAKIEPIEDEIIRNIFTSQALHIEKNTINQEQKSDSEEEDDENEQLLEQFEEEKQTNFLGMKNEQDENQSNLDQANPQDIEIELNEKSQEEQIRVTSKKQKKPKQEATQQSKQEFQGNDITFCLQENIDYFNKKEKDQMKIDYKNVKGKRANTNEEKQKLEQKNKKTDDELNYLQILIQKFKEQSVEYNRLNRLLTKTNISQLIIFQECFQLHVIEYIRHEFHKKKKPSKLQSIEKHNSNVVFQNQFLQKILKKEEKNQYDEKSIIKSDQLLIQKQKDLIKKVYMFSKFQILNKELLMKSQRSFLGRVTDEVFKVKRENELKLKFLGFDEGFLEQKSNIQKILTYLQLHPCYIVKILKSHLLSFDDCKILIQSLFNAQSSNHKNRLNFLLISIFKEMLVYELQHYEKFEIQNTSKNALDSKPAIQFGKDCKMISIFIFKQVFKSKQTNVDTILCLVCHVLNYIMATFQGSLPNQQDDSLDIKDEIFKENAEKESKKGKKSNKTVEKTSNKDLQNRCENLQLLIDKTLKAMIDNTLLKENTQFYNFKKKIVDQMELIKKDIKSIVDYKKDQAKKNKEQKININQIAGIDPEKVKENYPIFRWSEEINYMLHFLVEKISEDGIKFPNKDLGFLSIHQQIFALLFDEILEQIEDEKQFDILMLPYISKIKLIQQVEVQLKNTHQKNKKNSLHALRMILSYQNMFQEKKDDQHIKDLNKAMNEIFIQNKNLLLDRILRYGKEDSEILSYKNFEYQLVHSLDQEDSYLIISKQFVGKIISLFCQNQNLLSLQKPIINDPLIKIVKQIESYNSNKKNFIEILLNPPEGAPDPQFRFKLKTRLYINYDYKDNMNEKQIDEKLQNFCRCIICQAPLTCELAVQKYDQDIILQRYKPQDVQSLPVKFVDVLKVVSNNPQKKQIVPNFQHPNMASFIDACEYEARKFSKDYKINELLLDFKEKLIVQVENYQNKKKEEKEKQDNLEKLRQDAANGEFSQKVKKVKKDAKHEKEEKIKDTDEVIQQLIEQTEQRLNSRILQKFNSDIINAHISTYLEPMIIAKMEHFQNKIMQTNQTLAQNYEYGLSNKEFFAILQNSKTFVPQMFNLVQKNTEKDINEEIGKSLPKTDPKKIRGFLSSDVQSLMKDGTIVNVKLVELKELMNKCNIVLVETDDQKMIEFKMVFRVLKKQLCGPDIVTQEHTMINFMIDPKILKSKLQKLTLQQKEINESQDKKKKQQVLVLVFEESDALEFNPVKFQELIMKMESSKSVFAQQAQKQQQK